MIYLVICLVLVIVVALVTMGYNNLYDYCWTGRDVVVTCILPILLTLYIAMIANIIETDDYVFRKKNINVIAVKYDSDDMSIIAITNDVDKIPVGKIVMSEEVYVEKVTWKQKNTIADKLKSDRVEYVLYANKDSIEF